MKVALLTGGKDPHYARGLASQLARRGIHVALVGGGEEMPDRIPDGGRVDFYDFVGRQDAGVALAVKVARVLKYYVRLLWFAVTTDAKLFHILWFRRFPRAERSLLVPFLKLLGKKVVFTAHNVDDRARDGREATLADRLSLQTLYRLVDHVMVHTPPMASELLRRFAIPHDRVSVVPLGINDVIPVSRATRVEARHTLGLDPDARVVLFFGNIAPYKGIEDLIRAMAVLVAEDDRLALLVVGQIKDPSATAYWRRLEALVMELGIATHVRQEIRYIPDHEVGLFFRAADVSALPYRRIYQSGVLALSYAQGLPVIAADVGSMRDDVVEGKTGLLFAAGDAGDLAAKIRTYFRSDLFKDLDASGDALREHGAERFSWHRNAERTHAVYASLLR